MKGLNQFVKFDWNAFATDKQFLVTGTRNWDDNDTKTHKGMKVDVVIWKDGTSYTQKDGQNVNNRFEKITFKVKKDVSVPVNAFINPINAEAKVYGEYRNQLSVTCDDIHVIQQGKA